MDDNKIIELFFARSEQAITEIKMKYGGLCHEISFNILRNESDVQECTNDIYLALWDTIPPAKPDPLAAYIARITRNQAIKRYHQNTAKKRNSFYDVALEELENCIPTEDSIEDLLDAKELALYINHFLSTLSKKNRIIFIRRYYFSDSVSDIAKKMKIDARKVTLSLSRSREKLRKYLFTKGVSI